MKNWIVTAALLGATHAAAGPTENWHLRGHNVVAQFFSDHECGSTTIVVFAGEDAMRSGGAPVETAMMSVSYDRVNWCAGEVFFGHGTTEQISYSANQTQEASVSATVVVGDFAGVSETLQVQLAWTGVGDVMRGSSHSHLQSGPTSLTSHQVGSSRDAVVSGSVTNSAGVNLIAGMTGTGNVSVSSMGSIAIRRRR